MALLALGLFAGAARAETLAVTMPTPAGVVASSPAGISCQAFYCESDFAAGSQVALTATPIEGFAFAGFYDDCTGPSCLLTMDGLKRVRAEFVRFAEQSYKKLRRIRATGTAIVTIRAGGPGTLVLSGGQVKRQVETISAASNVDLEVAAKGAAARRLRRSGDATVGIEVTFTPSAGTAATLSRRVRLHLNLAQFEL